MMRKIINTSKFTLALFFLLLGIANIQAASNDCLLDVFQAELKEKNSEELYNYFLNKPEDECNIAYNAWQVLYKADKNVDRFDINNLKGLAVYLKRSILDIDALAARIEKAGGYNSFKKTVFWSAAQTDEPYGITLLKDLESSEEIAGILTESPDLLNSWKVLYELEVSNTFRQHSANVEAMHNHIEKINNMNDKFSVHHLNEFVKHTLNKDAYLESVLFPGKLYGGIQVPQNLIMDIKPLHGSLDKNFIADFMQYTGTESDVSFFGAYEVRVNSGKIQRYFVDDSGVGSWKNLNGTRQEAINFVVTVDGRLRLGHGHHNLSGEADYVMSAGKLVITDGIVTEIANYSGHYTPSHENLYDAEKIFKSLGVTSDDFKLYFNTNAKETTSPIKNTNENNVVEFWINNLDAELKSDLLKYDELYDLFRSADATQREKLVKAWEVLKKSELNTDPVNLLILTEIVDRFKYDGKQGFQALAIVLDAGQSNSLRVAYGLEKLNNMFDVNLDLPIKFTCAYRRGDMPYSPLVLDGVGDEIIGVVGREMVKKKFFKNIDASYEKVGEYEGRDIYRKGDEIGFKSADVINIFGRN